MPRLVHVLHRLTIAASAFPLAGLGLYIAAVAVDGLPGARLSGLGFAAEAVLPPQGRAIWIALAVVILGVAAAAMVLAVWPASRRSSRPLPLTVAGDPDPFTTVSVAPATLRRLAGYEARQVAGVSGVNSTVVLGESGWDLGCDIEVGHGSPVRDLAQEVAERLRRTMEHHTGIPVHHVDVKVDVRPVAVRGNLR